MPNYELLAALRAYVAVIAPGRTATWLKIQLDNEPARWISLPVPPPPARPAPDGPGEDDLTECERDVIEVIEAAEKRLTTEQVKNALQAAGKLHGDSTVIKALAALVQRKGKLTNKKDTYGKGYGLADWS